MEKAAVSAHARARGRAAVKEAVEAVRNAARLPFKQGLVEERAVFLDVNLDKLRVTAQEVAGADVEAFANHLMSIFGPGEDDVAMIALRRIP